MSDKKPKCDEQATKAQPNDDNKDKFEFFQPTSSQSFSSGFANQFLLNSPNASFLGTITEPAEGDITSMMDVPIQQDVPIVMPEPFDAVTVSIILKKIDVVLLKRRIMRSLEVLVGGRTTKTDKRLLQRTV
ncbi:hypothetical protein Tco_0316691 [Tanacetum coccineum]